MKKKELKNLAKKIAKAELILQQSSDPQEIAKAREEIFQLCGSVHNLEDMTIIDEMVLDILEEST